MKFILIIAIILAISITISIMLIAATAMIAKHANKE